MRVGAASEASASDANETKTSNTALHKAAGEFEQILLRTMLSSLGKTGSMSKSGGSATGGDVYSSMVVGAMAEAISKAGGIGLASVIERSAQNLTESSVHPSAPSTTPTPSGDAAGQTSANPGGGQAASGPEGATYDTGFKRGSQ